MITEGLTYLGFLVLFSGVVVVLEKKSGWRVFDYVPAIVVIYFSAMLMSTFGVWSKTPSVDATYKTVKSAVLPAMVFLMLLRCDLRRIYRLGPRMILGFFTAAVSIATGFIVTYLLFRGYYDADTWKSFAALCGSWMGGTGNMVAVQGALNVPDARLGYALLMDSINYSVWVMILLACVPYAEGFNRWVGADTALLDEVGAALSRDREATRQDMQFADLILLFGLGLFVSAISHAMAAWLPKTPFLTATTWSVLTATLLGTIGALTALGNLAGSDHISNLFLYTLVALIASRADFAQLGKAPLYIASGFVILAVHGLVMVAVARIFRLDLFTCAVASLANIGGVASAPILAAAYDDILVPIGVLMAMMGYVVGTGGGLLVGKILSLM